MFTLEMINFRFNTGTTGVIAKAVGQNGSASAFQAVHADSGLAGVYLVVEGSQANQAVSNVVGALKSLKVADIEGKKFCFLEYKFDKMGSHYFCTSIFLKL